MKTPLRALLVLALLFGSLQALNAQQQAAQESQTMKLLTLKKAQERTMVSPVRFRPWLQAFRDYAFDRRPFEGKEIRAKRIPKKQLVTAWRTLSSEPLPKVKALKLSDDDFNYFLQYRQCIEDDFREIEEWGRVLPTKGTDACVFNGDETDDSDYIILVRENSYHSLDEIIVHELLHIARGDL